MRRAAPARPRFDDAERQTEAEYETEDEAERDIGTGLGLGLAIGLVESVAGFGRSGG